MKLSKEKWLIIFLAIFMFLAVMNYFGIISFQKCFHNIGGANPGGDLRLASNNSCFFIWQPEFWERKFKEFYCIYIPHSGGNSRCSVPS